MVAAYSASLIKISLFRFSFLPLAWVVYVPLIRQHLPEPVRMHVPMEFSIKLSSPIGQLCPVTSFFPDTIVEFGETTSHLDKRELTTDIITLTYGSRSSEFLHHRWSWTTSTITITKEVQCLGWGSVRALMQQMGRRTGDFEVLVVGHSSSDLVDVGPDSQ